MTDIGMNFDATQVEPQTSAGAVPTGWYNVIISNSEMKKTSAGTGAYLELTLKILDGQYANRQAWDRLNLYNPHQVAVEIARGTLSAICHATGVFQVRDSSVLHGKPLMARLVHKPAHDGYDESNDVKGYAKIGEKQTNESSGGPSAPPEFSPPATSPMAPPAASASWSPPPTAAPSQTPPPAPTNWSPPPAAPSQTPPWGPPPGEAAPQPAAPQAPDTSGPPSWLQGNQG